jgi:hypothetical protein
LPKDLIEKNYFSTTCVNFTTLASTAGGVIATVFSSDPSTSADFAELAAVFGDYRCLGFEIEALPFDQYSKTVVHCEPGVGVLDRANSTALASLNASEGYGSSRRLSLENPWKMTLKVDNIDEASFLPTNATVAFEWIKLYFANLTVSTNYMQILQRWRVQFRQRR